MNMHLFWLSTFLFLHFCFQAAVSAAQFPLMSFKLNLSCVTFGILPFWYGPYRMDIFVYAD